MWYIEICFTLYQKDKVVIKGNPWNLREVPGSFEKKA